MPLNPDDLEEGSFVYDEVNPDEEVDDSFGKWLAEAENDD